MANPRKEQQIDDLVDRMSRAELSVIADYRGLTVSQLQELRGRLRPLDADFKVAKNTLTRIAASRLGIEGLDPELEGPTAIMFAYGDVVAPAKALSEFARTSRILEIRAGVLNNLVVKRTDIEAIATLPSRDELVGKLVGLLASPMARTVGVLSGPPRSLAYVVNARIESMGGDEAATAAD